MAAVEIISNNGDGTYQVRVTPHAPRATAKLEKLKAAVDLINDTLLPQADTVLAAAEAELATATTELQQAIRDYANQAVGIEAVNQLQSAQRIAHGQVTKAKGVITRFKLQRVGFNKQIAMIEMAVEPFECPAINVQADFSLEPGSTMDIRVYMKELFYKKGDDILFSVTEERYAWSPAPIIEQGPAETCLSLINGPMVEAQNYTVVGTPFLDEGVYKIRENLALRSYPIIGMPAINGMSKTEALPPTYTFYPGVTYETANLPPSMQMLQEGTATPWLVEGILFGGGRFPSGSISESAYTLTNWGPPTTVYASEASINNRYEVYVEPHFFETFNHRSPGYVNSSLSVSASGVISGHGGAYAWYQYAYPDVVKYSPRRFKLRFAFRSADYAKHQRLEVGLRNSSASDTFVNCTDGVRTTLTCNPGEIKRIATILTYVAVNPTPGEIVYASGSTPGVSGLQLNFTPGTYSQDYDSPSGLGDYDFYIKPAGAGIEAPF